MLCAPQPFAWGAREFLRNLAVGKRVTFHVEAQSTPARSYGAVFMEDGTPLTTLLVAAGWAKPRQGAPADLIEAGAAAEAAALGMYTQSVNEKSSAVRDVQWAGTYDPATLLPAMKGKPQNAIIEQVPTGSTVRCVLLPGFQQITLMLSGIQCGGFRRNEDGTEEAAPFAREARYFVESRLLNRDVQVGLEGVDKNGSLLGTIIHPAGNISVELVKVGLARVVDWSSQICAAAPQLRAAERAAKERRLRLWKDYVPPNHGGDMVEFQGKVVEVVSGDTLVVSENGVERRFSLASLRCPRMGKEPEPYANESKEYLRKILIGKKVQVVPEYKRTAPAGTGGQERVFATIMSSGKNAGEAMVSEGLAVVSRQGQSEERSVHFETLLEVEEVARSAKKGVHAAGDAPRASVTDLTTPGARDRAQRFLSALQRHGKVRAIVQFIPNGTRFKVLVPKENVLANFACVGMRCPMCARKNDPNSASEPYGDEAAAFARDKCFQREVDLEVETVDKNGTFFGNMFLPDKRNYGVLLVEAGLARLVQPAADRSSCGSALAEAERAAKSDSLKIWENYSAEEEAANHAQAELIALEEAEPMPDEKKQVVELMLTEIVDGAKFYAHVAGDTAHVTALQQQVATVCKAAAPGGFEPKIGGYCCALFSEDEQWYRAKVTARGATEFTVFFLDYGNSATVKKPNMRALDPSLDPKAGQYSPQALECRLAHVIAGDPGDGGDGEAAAYALSDAAWGKVVLARVEERSGDALNVTLFDKEQQNLNELLVKEGLVRVTKANDKRFMPQLRALREKEQDSRTRRMGMWRYGDMDDDDDDEFGMRRQQKLAATAAAAPTTGAWGKK